MKTRLSLLLALLLCLVAPARSHARVSFSFFFDNLDPYGEWVDVPAYGYCWRPVGVDRDWRPYSDGYWTYTDAGWTWASYEDWGGITYHYGRWAFLEGEGWCWVPGYEWGPAWVSWRSSNDYVGWAPLPPDVRFQPSIGISVWVDRTYDIGPSYYNFCRTRYFGAPVMRGVIVPYTENVTIINQTVNITNITVNKEKNVIYNGGPRYEQVITQVDRPIPTLKLVQETDVKSDRRRGGLHAQQRGNELVVAAPEVEPAQGKIKLPKPAKVVADARIDKGWGTVKDPERRKEIRQRMERETVGLTPENAPAKPVIVSVEKEGLLKPAPTATPELAPTTTQQPAVSSGQETPGRRAAQKLERQNRRSKSVEQPVQPQVAPPELAQPEQQPTATPSAQSELQRLEKQGRRARALESPESTSSDLQQQEAARNEQMRQRALREEQKRLQKENDERQRAEQQLQRQQQADAERQARAQRALELRQQQQQATEQQQQRQQQADAERQARAQQALELRQQQQQAVEQQQQQRRLERENARQQDQQRALQRRQEMQQQQQQFQRPDTVPSNQVNPSTDQGGQKKKKHDND